MQGGHTALHQGGARISLSGVLPCGLNGWGGINWVPIWLCRRGFRTVPVCRKQPTRWPPPPSPAPNRM